MLKKIINPKFVFLLYVLPFLIICPLVLSSLITGFPFDSLINNSKIEPYREIFLNLKLSEDSQRIGREIVEIDNFTLGNNSCGIMAAQIIETDLEETDLSQNLLTNFQKLASVYSDDDNYKLILNSDIKYLPIDINQDNIQLENFEASIKDDFNVKSFNQDKTPYVIYLLNFNAFDNRDIRCR